MNAAKQRRYLIVLCISQFIAWIVTTFGLIILWHVKGGPADAPIIRYLADIHFFRSFPPLRVDI